MTRADRRLRRAWATIATVWLAKAQAAVHHWGFGEPIWVSADGTVCTYSELSDRHLRNILRVLEREGEAHTERYSELRKELSRRAYQQRYR